MSGEFHAINERVSQINGRLRQLDLDNKAMVAATQKAEDQRKLVEDLKAKANDDLGKIRYELARDGQIHDRAPRQVDRRAKRAQPALSFE